MCKHFLHFICTCLITFHIYTYYSGCSIPGICRSRIFVAGTGYWIYAATLHLPFYSHCIVMGSEKYLCLLTLLHLWLLMLESQKWGMQVVFTGWIDSLQRMNLEGRLREAVKYRLADFSKKGGGGTPWNPPKVFHGIYFLLRGGVGGGGL